MRRLEKAIQEAMKDPEFLAASTDDPLLAFLPGAEWEKALQPTKQLLQPLAASISKD